MNGYGLWTLLAKEIRRFLRVPGQTVLSPLVTTTLYFVVFGYALGGALREVGGVPYGRFILPGLVTLGVVTNAYLNSASSLFVMKLQGTIVDLLVSPLSYGEILAGFLGGRYAQDKPLSLSASITFEQSYEGVDGDSASSTEKWLG